VVALTGGYRKTPLLQIGADIYCDTALIARVLEQIRPSPTLYPASAPLAPLLAQWADSTLFWTMIPYAMQPAGVASIFGGLPPEAVKAFAADRAPFSAGVPRRTAVDATVQLRAILAALDAQLAGGRAHLLGEQLCIADFSMAHCLWFLRRAGPLAEILLPHKHLLAWLERVLGVGHGTSHKMLSEEALLVAATASAHAPTEVLPSLGFDAGAAVTVAAIDSGTDPVAGTLVGLSEDEVVLRRTDERAGLLHVHFPRAGFQIRRDKKESA
jgi:glutathione S-transferase